MHRFFFLIILGFLVFNSSCRPYKPAENVEAINPKWKKIPAGWIEKAQRFTYTKRDTTLLSEFANIIKPDTLNNGVGKGIDPDYNFIFNAVSVDLDGDQVNELVCLQGRDVYAPYLCIFKNINHSWYLVYREEIDTFYGSPTLYVANNYSKNKTFYLRRVYDHGSGIFIDGYTFYKFEANHTYKCLDIINNAHIEGWGLYINQSVKSTFEFRGDSNDELEVRYSYNFFPGDINQDGCSWCANDDVSLINGEDNVDYIYDIKEHKYKLKILRYKNSSTDLTAEKISCFGDFGNDSLFVKAFRRHIDTTLKIGTPMQKKILRKFLSLAGKNQPVTTDKMEEKTRAGGTVFYGPK